MNLEINIKVPIGEPGVSITQGTDAASEAHSIPLLPPGLPEWPAPQLPVELPEGQDAFSRFDGPERIPQPPGNGSFETNGHGAVQFASGESGPERDIQPPALEELQRLGGDRGTEIGPPDPATLALQTPQEGFLGQPPGLEGLSFGEPGTTVSEAPPSLEELGMLVAAGAESEMPPSLDELEEMTKGRKYAQSKPRRAPKKTASSATKKSGARKTSASKDTTGAEAPG